MAWPSAYCQGYAEGIAVGVVLPRATRCACQGRALPEGLAVGVLPGICRGLSPRRSVATCHSLRVPGQGLARGSLPSAYVVLYAEGYAVGIALTIWSRPRSMPRVMPSA